LSPAILFQKFLAISVYTSKNPLKEYYNLIISERTVRRFVKTEGKKIIENYNDLLDALRFTVGNAPYFNKEMKARFFWIPLLIFKTNHGKVFLRT